MKITFLGGVGTVTGSKTMVTHDGGRFLVDAGLFQGLKHLRLRNWERLPFDPRALDAVVLTHAHLDHSGALPLLARAGFAGPIYATSATAALLPILLRDAAWLQEEDARYANKRGFSRHKPARPLYDVADVERALRLIRPMPFDRSFPVDGARVTFTPVGHVLGAASVRVESQGRSLVMSGDVGRTNDVLLRTPAPFAGADALVLESTYGDRLHVEQDAREVLAHVVNRVCGRGGVLLVPTFAVGRTQALLHLLADLTVAGRIPAVPTFLNSPMGIAATQAFLDHPEAHRLSRSACEALADRATFVRDVEESKALNRRGGPMILIAGSGMATGGRILHHLEAFGPDPNNGILLVGYQAAGTRGEAIASGAPDVKIHGEQIPIRAERFEIDALSGHADWRELVDWVRGAPEPRKVLLNHGEPTAAEALARHLQEELGWRARVAGEETVDV